MVDVADLYLDIKTLLSEMENRPEDRHEFHLQLKEKLRAMRAYGMPLPDDLKELEARLDAEFAGEAPKPKTH